MIPITPLTIVVFQIVAACVAYAMGCAILQILRWFVAFCVEIAE